MSGRPADLTAWPVVALERTSDVRRGPWAWDLTLGRAAAGGALPRRLSPPAGPAGEATLRAVLAACASLGPRVILPWAVRSPADMDRLLEGLVRHSRRPPAELVVPIVASGFLGPDAQAPAHAGYARAALGDPSLYRSAVARLDLGEGDMVLLAPLPPGAKGRWLRDLAALAPPQVATVARGVTSRALAAELRDAGVSHASGRALGEPSRAPVGVA